METTLQSIIENELDDSVMHASDIPSIDLYMDQIITLVEEKLDSNRRTPEEKLLTKTMINNYSKEGLIKPVKGKKYSKEHILQMLAVYTLKNTLSIGEIKTALQHVRNDSEFDLESAWEQALVLREKQRSAVPALLDEICVPDDFDENSDADKFATLLAVTALSTYCQRIAQGMIETYFAQEQP